MGQNWEFCLFSQIIKLKKVGLQSKNLQSKKFLSFLKLVLCFMQLHTTTSLSKYIFKSSQEKLLYFFILQYILQKN